ESFYDGCNLMYDPTTGFFSDWMNYSMKGSSFQPSSVLEALTWFDLPDDEAAAYDAPYPTRIYLAGPRVFPSLINELPGVNYDAWAGLSNFEKPFLTLWAANDPGSLGSCETQQLLIDSIPGARGLPHKRLAEASHFLQDDQGEAIAQALVGFYSTVPLRRGDRYCEVLLVKQNNNAVEAEVWGTHNLNYCPAESWDALDAEVIKTETGAQAVIMNGPRFWLVNTTSGNGSYNEFKTFGDLETRLLAKLEIDPSDADREPYTEGTVLRSTIYTFNSGEEIYELTSSDGEVYVMQAMSQTVNTNLTLSDLPTLGSSLSLPDGWAYTARTLEEDLVLTADGEAIVIQDELANTYQRR
ncbi:MAG: hypothetical protein OQK04_06975, partial [Kangiellaceae bacterium]|nr:hypothetical protein [Kangiellaceae bacterium]